MIYRPSRAPPTRLQCILFISKLSFSNFVLEILWMFFSHTKNHTYNNWRLADNYAFYNITIRLDVFERKNVEMSISSFFFSFYILKLFPPPTPPPLLLQPKNMTPSKNVTAAKNLTLPKTSNYYTWPTICEKLDETSNFFIFIKWKYYLTL